MAHSVGLLIGPSCLRSSSAENQIEITTCRQRIIDKRLCHRMEYYTLVYHFRVYVCQSVGLCFDFLFIVSPIVGVCNCSMFCCRLLYIHSSIAIISMGKRGLVALLSLSSWCLVMVEQLFLTVPWGCLRFVNVVFPDHTHLLSLCFVCLCNSNTHLGHILSTSLDHILSICIQPTYQDKGFVIKKS